MGRVLGVVVAALVFFIASLGLAVYLTRDEDNLQADTLLAENFTKAVTLAPQRDGTVDLRQLARFEWGRVLLERARRLWSSATILCITHDVSETLAFDRVLVVSKGQIIEDGRPEELAKRPASRYRATLDAEAAVRDGLWSGPGWRELTLEDGRLAERPSGTRIRVGSST